MTRDFKKLTLDEALIGLNAMLAEAEKDPTRPVTMGVSDECGTMLCFYRMDGTGEFSLDMVMKKCFTSAWLGDSTAANLRIFKERDYPFYEFNHSYATAIPGGVPIVPPGGERDVMKGGDVRHMRGQVGACAVAGRRGHEDEAIALIGAEAIQKAVWGKK